MAISALITGVTGSAGSYMADFLKHNKPTEVKAFGISRWHSTSGNHNLKKSRDHLKLFDCDLLDLSAIIRTLTEIKPDVIFHFASHANVLLSFYNPLSVVDNNVRSTLNLLEALRILKMKPIVVAASTSEVYGKISIEDTPINENLIMRPMSPYGASKAFQDHIELVYFEAFNIPIIRTRMFTYVNARRGDLFATSWARQIVEIEDGKRAILKHGNLESVRTLLDVRDAMEAYWLAFQKGQAGEAYNVGGTQSVQVGEVLKYLIGQSKVKIETQLDQSLVRPSDVTLQIPDCTKFINKTGWRPKYDVNSALDYLLLETRESFGAEVRRN
jgi:GDPmannose 4,6-dehydratase/GDP-4-dehydro-6-deoxy-D-mannose reductase